MHRKTCLSSFQQRNSAAVTLFLSAEPEAGDLCSMLLTAFSLVLVLVTLPFSLCVSVKVSSLARFVCLAIISWLNYCLSKKSFLIMSLTRYTKCHQCMLCLTSFGRLCKSMSEPWCSDWDGCGPVAPRALASSLSCPVLTPTRRWTFERSHLTCRHKR